MPRKFFPNLSWQGALLALLVTSFPLKTAAEFITLASGTSLQASGLYDYLLPIFQKRSGVEVRVIAVGTGQALKLGQKGDADVLLVHDKAGELKFIREGYGVHRREVMYNDFIIVGPKNDPAGVKGLKDAVGALKKISSVKARFISRGDDSGNHRMELRLWDEAKVDVKAVSGTWYKEIGADMGRTLNTAAGLHAYTLSDRATWLSFKNRGNLALLDEGDPRLFNPYSVILVNPEKHKHVKQEAAKAFMDWMTSPEGQKAVGAFSIEGQVLFHPSAARSR
jgi:tungstate transport system substrate-binding protein